MNAIERQRGINVQVQSNRQRRMGLKMVQPGSTPTVTRTQARITITLPQWSTPKLKRGKAGSRTLRWVLLWVSVTGILGISGALAMLWLFHTPASQCYALSTSAAPGRQLFCAQQGASSGDPEQLLVALETLTEVIDHPTLAPEAQRLLREWSAKGIMIAQAQVEQGNLEAGIAIANRIPLESPLYPDAQAVIAVWREEWQQGEEIVRQFHSALETQAWETATQLFLSLSQFENDYWRTRRADQLMFELSEAKTAWQKRQELASFLTANVSTQQERLIAILVEIGKPRTARQISATAWETTVLNLFPQLWQQQQLDQLRQIAQVIQPESNIYVEAQDWLLLAQATELAAAETDQGLEDAMILLQSLNEQSVVYNLAQQQQTRWQDTRQALQAQVAKAKTPTLLPFTHPPQNRQMIGVVKSIHPKLDAQERQALQKLASQHKLEQARRILQEATTLADQQQWSVAIEKAAQIQPGQPLYQQAQIAIAIWKAQL